MQDDLRSIAENTGTSFEASSLWSGSIWLSARLAGPRSYSQSYLPPGLHIGVGSANISSFSDRLGGFATSSPVITAMHVPEGGVTFDTHVQPGSAHSFGIHLPPSEDEEQHALVSRIQRAVEGRKLAIIEGPRANQLMRLVAPVEPWFDDASRGLLMQSRALELVASVSALIDGSLEIVARRTEIKHACQVRDLVEEDLSAEHRLDNLARKSSISVRSLTSSFRQTFGESIGQYLIRRRMEEAHRLLSEGLSVNQTAYQVGYKPNALTTAFRRHYGYPPSQLGS
ncbi:MAG: AraC family transcriptional regulator [Pseudomonadota bacterium]